MAENNKKMTASLEDYLEAIYFLNGKKIGTYEDYGDKNNSKGVMMCPHVSVAFSYILK